MSTTNAPFGLQPVYHPSGTVRSVKGTIATGYSTAIYKNGPVKLATSGTLQAAAAGDTLIGSFQGCEYTDANGLRVVSPYWPASTTATEIVAYYVRDPEVVFAIQADGSVATAAIGECADITNATAGSTLSGLAGVTMSATTSTTQATLQVLGIPEASDNTSGDTYTIVHVRINEHSLKSPVAGT